MGRLYAGTSGWAYTSWKPGFYPQNVPARSFLSHYSTRLNTVEVNYTFRSRLKPEQIRSWLAATGEDFRFSFKAPEMISHRKRLRDCVAEWCEFLAAIQPVSDAGKMGAVLLQFPPNFRAQSKGKDKMRNHDSLVAFLRELRTASAQARVAVEFRDPSWFAEDTYAVLREHSVALCWAEADKLETPQVQTADFLYLRLRCSSYGEAEIGASRQSLAATAISADVFAYFKHEEQPDGALRAEKLLHNETQ